MEAMINEHLVIFILWCCAISKINYFFKQKTTLFWERIKYLQEKHELQADYVIGGQMQHKCLKIQKY